MHRFLFLRAFWDSASRSCVFRTLDRRRHHKRIAYRTGVLPCHARSNSRVLFRPCRDAFCQFSFKLGRLHLLGVSSVMAKQASFSSRKRGLVACHMHTETVGREAIVVAPSHSGVTAWWSGASKYSATCCRFVRVFLLLLLIFFFAQDSRNDTRSVILVRSLRVRALPFRFLRFVFLFLLYAEHRDG